MAITPNSGGGLDDSGNGDSHKKEKQDKQEKSVAKKAVKKKTLTKKSTAADQQAEASKPAIVAGARTGLLAFFCSILGLAVFAGALYGTAPFWYDHLKTYLPAALKDPFDDPRIQAVAKKAGAVDDLKQAQASDTVALKKLDEERTKISEQLNVLMKRLDAQDQSLKSMRKMIEATSPPSDAVDAESSLSRLSAKLSQLDTNKGALEKMLQRIAKLEQDEKEIVRITKRLKTLEKSGPKTMDAVTGASATVLAVNQLRDAIRQATPFKKELGLVKRLSIGNADMMKAIAILEPISSEGLPTVTVLKYQFTKTAQDIIKAAHQTAEQSWVDRVMNRLKGLITIRKIKNDGDVTPGALVSRAEDALDSGRLDEALTILSKLTGNAGQAAAAWIKAARSRVDAERALASLHVQAVALLAPQQNQTSETTK